jgi:hypothetical protein
MTFRRSRIRSRESAIAKIPRAGRFAAGSWRLPTAVAVCVAGLVLATPAGGALEVRLSASPKRPAALELTRITLRTYLPLLRANGSCCRLEAGGPTKYPFRVEAVSPARKTSRISMRHAEGNEWHGAVRFQSPGRWTIRVANYGPSYRHVPGALPRISVDVGAPVPTPPPAGFGALGRTGCAPPSPADASSQGFRDIFGTAVGDEELWALPFLPKGATWAQTDAAVFDGLVGKEVKIVFGMTTFHPPLRAVGPDGASISPIWGPAFHGSSNWIRQPGSEWGAGFVFPEPGCWRIAVGTRGDVWIRIPS